jgi:hypothetical protein
MPPRSRLDTDPLRVFIGWDSKEPVAFAVAAHSILRRASRPVAIVPLALESLRSVYTRERGLTESTEFSLTRFLVPFLSGYRGLSVFMDCDVVVQADIYDLVVYPLAFPGKAVFACQHDYIPKGLTKFDGHEQTKYPRKNWSSVMLFVNDQCTALTPEYVNKASGLELHRFKWTTDEQIGALPLEWNHLVGEYVPNPSAQILHYTNGIPAYPTYRECDQADVWWNEYDDMLRPHADVVSREYRGAA